MKKAAFAILASVFMIFSVTILSACANYTDQEIVLETKMYLKEKYNQRKIYDYGDLETTYYFKHEYKTYIEWSSKDMSVIDTINEKVNQTNSAQSCILTATIYYKNASGSVDIQVIVPRKGIIIDSPVIDNL